MDPYWRSRASCKDEDVKYFTLGVKDDGVSSDWLKRTAEQFCTTCPVKQECLEFAEREDLFHTIRGGKIPARRKKLPESFVSATEDVDKFIAKGKCSRKRKPHKISGPDDVVVHLDSGRAKGFRLRCFQCQEEAFAKYEMAKRGTIDA